MTPEDHLSLFLKFKITFLAIFLLAGGFAYTKAVLVPTTYRITMLLSAPNLGRSSTSEVDLESAERLKSSIQSGVYDHDVSSRLKIDIDRTPLEFDVLIPAYTDLLRISIDIPEGAGESGVDILNALFESIAADSEKLVSAEMAEIGYQINKFEIARDKDLKKLNYLRDHAKPEIEIKQLELQVNEWNVFIDQMRARQLRVSNAQVKSPPTISAHPVKPEKKKGLILSVLIGCIWGTAAVLTRVYLQQRKARNRKS
jgi:capsular polysaccharide biosynthesis protein